MTSVNTIRLPGLATGMDTDTMVKNMLSGEQAKIDRVKQKEQTIKWQQELYRDIIKDIKGFKENYFSVTSPNSIVSSDAWNSLAITSSNENVISATGSAGASNINYDFDVVKLADSASATSSKEMNRDSKLVDLGANAGDKFKIAIGKDEAGKTIYSDSITIEDTDTVDSLVTKINNSTNGKAKASYSEMTGKFTIESSETGENSSLEIVTESGTGTPPDALGFLGLKSKKYEYDTNGNFVLDTNGKPKYTEENFTGSVKGSNSIVNVSGEDGFKKTLNEESNSFNIDGINYTVNSIGTAKMTSKQDVQPIVDNMKKFVEDYNKIMDEMYGLITEKKKPDYPPLTEEQKKDMEKEEIEAWEKKAKVGLLRNDTEMRSFMDHMQTAIFGGNSDFLRECGLTTNEDYTKRGQLSLDEDKFKKALETNGDKVYKAFNGENGMLEKMNDTMYDYVGSSSSVFAKKAGLEKTASATNNFYSEQLKRQADTIKNLQRKMDNKENQLYKQFGQLEASMNKLNSQMNYFMQM